MKAYKKKVVILGAFIIAASIIAVLMSAFVLNRNKTTLSYESLKNQQDTSFFTDDKIAKIQDTLMKIDGIASAAVTMDKETQTAVVNIKLSSKERSLSSEKETKVKDIVADAVGIAAREKVTILYTV